MEIAFIIIGIILLLVVIGVVVLYFVGTKLQKKQESSQAQMQAAAQTVSLLVIDKKRMKLKEANLPQIVVDQTPKYLRGSKVPIVKAKIGPKIMTLICDEKIFDSIPVKKEVKAVLSGIYIMDVKGVRANLEVKPAKQSMFKKLKNTVSKKANK